MELPLRGASGHKAPSRYYDASFYENVRDNEGGFIAQQLKQQVVTKILLLSAIFVIGAVHVALQLIYSLPMPILAIGLFMIVAAVLGFCSHFKPDRLLCLLTSLMMAGAFTMLAWNMWDMFDIFIARGQPSPGLYETRTAFMQFALLLVLESVGGAALLLGFVLFLFAPASSSPEDVNLPLLP